MTIPAPPSAPDPVRWLNNQPYLLLSLTSLFWAGNIVLARYVAGHVPPMTLSCVRWIGAFLMLLPFARPHLRRDWPALRTRIPLMVLLSATGFAINNTLSYWALQFTQALNALLIQSSGPLFVALWSLLLFGVRLTWAQLAGIAISLAGVLTIILRGDLAALASIQFNKGDVMFAGALLSFGLYSALMPRRPKTHQLSLISFTTGCGALLLLPFSIWEFSTGFTLKPMS
jgi:drug/metabolite transporter (DMT)-like permease